MVVIVTNLTTSDREHDLMRNLRSLFVFPLLVVGLGCGTDAKNNGDGGSNNGSSGGDIVCGLDTTLSGAVEQTVAWGSGQGCAAASSGSLLTFTFGAFGGESIVVGASGGAGITAEGVDAYVTYRDADFEGSGEAAEWTTRDCTIDITRNELVESDPDFGDLYLVEGNGSCTTPATPMANGGAATGELTIGDFEFALEVPF